MTGQTDDAKRLDHLLFARPPRFMLSVANLDQLPDTELPEVAFSGRSNVGKSSLINALVNMSDLARTSNTPGRTQQLNFFALDERLRLVDLPGYGFAKAPKKQVERWKRLIFNYLRGRPNLRLVCVLVDGRHGLKSSDEDVMTLLAKAAVPFQVILTKADLVPARELEQRTEELKQVLRRKTAALPAIVLTSARKNNGIEALRSLLAAYAKEPG